MSDDVAIKVEDVSKTFKLPHEKTTSIKSAVVNFYKRNKTYETQQALSDVSFEVKKGEFFGIVGRNGSGKSTLLKLLAGIYATSKGHIQVNGKLTPFIELGVGFNPELSGRENVFLNGALLGFNRSEMGAMYEEIVAFAELERFMDQKLKNYSSGMQVRLAFSIAIRVKSDILVLDEVLAVGDEAFQNKCVKVFDDYKKNHQTVVLVTHDMDTVKKYCNNAILIDNGKLIEKGNPHEIATMYSKLNQTGSDDQIDLKKPSQLKIDIGSKTRRYKYGEELRVSLSWPKERQVEIAGLAIYSSVGECVYATNTELDKISVKSHNSIDYSADLTIGAGNYFLMAGIWAKGKQVIEFVAKGPEFIIENEGMLIGEGLTRLKHNWS